MAYLSYYRKYRPQNFEELVGQEHVTRTLQNAIRLNRLAHAYLFSGPRGTGKTSCARILAKALNCESGPTPSPCLKCSLCVRITSGNALNVMEIDAASNRGIDEVRDLREKIKFTPPEGNVKVYIVDEVHMLTTEASNALLKTLEEPPAHVVFVFATTEAHRIPATLLSRCQRFDFKRITHPHILEVLKTVAEKEKLHTTEQALSLLARASGGSLRDALSLLDQAVTFSGAEFGVEELVLLLGMVEDVTLFHLVESIATKNISRSLELVHQLFNQGKDATLVCKNLIEYFRNLLVYKTMKKPDEILVLSENAKKQLEDQKNLFTQDQLLSILKILSRTAESMRWEPMGRLLLEMALLQLMPASAASITADKPASAASLPALQAAQQAGVPPESSEVRSQTTPEPKTESKEQTDTKKEPENETLTAMSVEARWLDILNEVKNEDMPTYTFLLQAVPSRVDGNTLIIGFSQKASFGRKMFETKERIQILETALKKCLGKKLIIKTAELPAEPEIQAAKPEARLPVRPPASARAGKHTQTGNPKSEEALKKVMEIFEGSKVVE